MDTSLGLTQTAEFFVLIYSLLSLFPSISLFFLFFVSSSIEEDGFIRPDYTFFVSDNQLSMNLDVSYGSIGRGESLRKLDRLYLL